MKTINRVLMICAFLIATMNAFAEEPTNISENNNIVQMIDLGSHTCLPCKMMEPILERLSKRYMGRAEILFIDVEKHKSQAEKYNISLIPTQIFYTKYGEEIYRHEGFLGEKAAQKMLDILLEE